MPYGLTTEELEKMTSIFSGNHSIKKVVLYGSRAKGNFKPFSDIDITLMGDNLIKADLLAVINNLDELLLPYHFDVSLFERLKNQELIEHIKRKGIVIYKKEDK